MRGTEPLPDDGPRLRLLLVEDEALVAMHMQLVLETLGHEVLAKAPSVDHALSALAETAPEAALLDVSLNGVRVTPVAEALAARGIPFVLVTGYDECNLGDAALADRPVLTKPVKPQQLQQMLIAITTHRAAG